MIVGIIVGIVAVAVIVGFVLSISRVSGGLLKENGWRGLRSRLITKTENSESAQYDDDDFPKGTFGSFLGILV